MCNQKNIKYQGSWPVVLTPFDKNLKIDFDVYKEMIKWYIDNNAGGIYANCLSSEMYHLDTEEQLNLINETVKVAKGKLPIAATGNFGNSEKEHLISVKKISETNIDILMLLVPTFLDTDEDMYKYFMTMVENTEIQLGIYECPVPRSFHLNPELVKKLANTGRFVAFKETSCDLDIIKTHIDNTRNTKMSVLQANLPYLLESIRYGAVGTMNIASIWLPDLVDDIITMGIEKNPKADELHRDLCLLEMMQRVVHPKGTKYLLSKRGINIKEYSRAVPEKLSKEVIYSLDRISEKWINKDGSLNI